MKNIIVSLFVLLVPFIAGAQPKFIFGGSIEYERKINVHRQIVDEDQASDWFKEIIKTQPQYQNSNFVLNFSNNRTIYRPSGEITGLDMFWLTGPAKQNTVFTDFNSGKKVSSKAVFESNFLISDSLSTIEWRISEEKRTIAGFDCRKAVGIICDSVYVVAFYTDEIPVSGGPESFDGLPGMILGLAIPRLHTTWFATKVQLTQPSEKEFVMSSRGSKTDKPKLAAAIKTSFADWPKYEQRHLWWVML